MDLNPVITVNKRYTHVKVSFICYFFHQHANHKSQINKSPQPITEGTGQGVHAPSLHVDRSLFTSSVSAMTSSDRKYWWIECTCTLVKIATNKSYAETCCRTKTRGWRKENNKSHDTKKWPQVRKEVETYFIHEEEEWVPAVLLFNHKTPNIYCHYYFYHLNTIMYIGADWWRRPLQATGFITNLLVLRGSLQESRS